MRCNQIKIGGENSNILKNISAKSSRKLRTAWRLAQISCEDHESASGTPMLSESTANTFSLRKARSLTRSSVFLNLRVSVSMRHKLQKKNCPIFSPAYLPVNESRFYTDSDVGGQVKHFSSCQRFRFENPIFRPEVTPYRKSVISRFKGSSFDLPLETRQTNTVRKKNYILRISIITVCHKM